MKVEVASSCCEASPVMCFMASDAEHKSPERLDAINDNDDHNANY